MKDIKHLLMLTVALLTIGTSHAESLNRQRLSRSKDPWRIMQTILYNHFVDTTGFCVITPIDADLLYEITPDLAKAFHVKKKVDLSCASTLGEVICVFMQVKFAGCTGQTYDYYKYRYSTKLIYDSYLERYPDSPYAAEMRQKSECLKQYVAWSNCLDANDYLSVLLNYESSSCPYGGFVYLALLNKESRELGAYYVQNAISQSNYLYDYDYNDYDYNYNQYGGNNNYNYWFELPKDENQDNILTEKTYKF